jgi:hypothetical protein
MRDNIFSHRDWASESMEGESVGQHPVWCTMLCGVLCCVVCYVVQYCTVLCCAVLCSVVQCVTV